MATYQVTCGPHSQAVEADNEHDAWCKFVAGIEELSKSPNKYSKIVVDADGNHVRDNGRKIELLPDKPAEPVAEVLGTPIEKLKVKGK